jgi:hypothetical protein
MIREAWLPRVEPRYSNLKEVIHALGCRVVGPDEDVDDANPVGCGPALVQLYDDGRIVASHPINASQWAYAAHEAFHWACGPDTLDDEAWMLPCELAVYRCVASDEERRAAIGYLLGTGISGIEEDVLSIAEKHGSTWTTSETWRWLEEEAVEHGLPTDGSLPVVKPGISAW